MSQSNLKQNLLNFLQRKPNADARRNAAERDLINAESALGRTLFGNVEPGHQREFFMHKKNVWIWHEDGKTIRYEVRENGVYKKVDENGYRKVTGAELEHFRAAASAYLKLVKSRIYK
ncbi:MAG: hypothetical protein MJ154_01810 [Candidatus Saccharibacteria bacterium]|nr:hypothetical protein [Candidatus Saccharibacteria bacterium]